MARAGRDWRCNNLISRWIECDQGRGVDRSPSTLRLLRRERLVVILQRSTSRLWVVSASTLPTSCELHRWCLYRETLKGPSSRGARQEKRLLRQKYVEDLRTCAASSLARCLDHLVESFDSVWGVMNTVRGLIPRILPISLRLYMSSLSADPDAPGGVEFCRVASLPEV